MSVEDRQLSHAASGELSKRPTTLRRPLTALYATAKGRLVVVILLLAVITSTQSDVFLTWNNWSNLLQQIAIVGILACGTTLLMVAGGIDLSIGSGVSLTGVIVAWLLIHDWPIAIAVLLAILAATAIGSVNGVLAHYSPGHPFIVTLGMLTLLQGLALLIAPVPISGLPPALLDFAFHRVADIPVIVVIFLFIAALTHVLLSRTVFGRRLYAIGGLERAAELAGIRILRTKFVAYTLMGLLVGIAGVLLLIMLGTAQAYAGRGMELSAIAAVAVGGTPLSGGRGDIGGTLLGVLLIGMIVNALNLMSVSPHVQLVLTGAIVVIAVMSQRKGRTT